MWLSIARATARPLRTVGVRRPGAFARVVFLSSTARRQATATATAKKPVAAKKAPAKKPAAKGRAVAAKKPAAKKAAPKKKAVAKKAAPKKKKKAAPKKKPVGRRKKVLTPEQKKALQIRELRRVALFTPGAAREPSPRPIQTWKIFLAKDTEGLKGNTDTKATLTAWIKERSAKFRALSPTEVEALKQEVQLNKQRNETELHQWIMLHSPSDIAAINSARAKLRRLGLGPKWGRRIKDARLPKKPMTSFVNFASARWKSGDWEGLSVQEGSKKASAEWKALSNAERAAFATPA